MIRSRAAAVVGGTVLVVALAGCGGSERSDRSDASDEGTSAATPTPDESVCDLLSAEDRSKLAGKTVDTVAAADPAYAGQQCRWTSGETLVQLTSMPAADWAKNLPAAIANLEKSGLTISDQDRKELAQAQKVLADSGELSGSQACDVFTTMAEIGGAEPGSDRVINYVPVTDSVLSVSGQTCADETFTSVVLADRGLKESSSVAARAQQALDTARDNAAGGS